MKPADPYAGGALSPEHHERLVADLENYARDAGITPNWICDPMPDMTEQLETYLRRFRHHAGEGTAGVLFTKKSKLPLPADQYLSAIAGCLVRNFIRARVMTLGSVLDRTSTHTMPQLSCLLIPNFFYPASEGGTIASWQVSALHDLLVARQVEGLQTILFASDLNLLGKEYGLAFRELIDAHFIEIEG
jgi:hypothetical protein